MNGDSILEDNNSQDAVVHLRDFGPEPEASIVLHGGFFGTLEDESDPFILNDRPVGPVAGMQKVLGELHESHRNATLLISGKVIMERKPRLGG